jgi:hypothetical protein
MYNRSIISMNSICTLESDSLRYLKKNANTIFFNIQEIENALRIAFARIVCGVKTEETVSSSRGKRLESNRRPRRDALYLRELSFYYL